MTTLTKDFTSLPDVNVLEIFGSGDIQVRPSEWKREFFCLQNHLSDYYTGNISPDVGEEIVSLSRPVLSSGDVYDAANVLRHVSQLSSSHKSPGRLRAVQIINIGWCRAAITTDTQFGDGKVSVWLIDIGRSVNVDVRNLFSLHPKFIATLPLSLHVHLYNVEPGDKCRSSYVEDIQNILRRPTCVTLRRRGPPVDLTLGSCQMFSIPVDITWIEMVQLDPFLPNQEDEQSLVKLLQDMSDDTVEITLEEEEDIEYDSPVIVREFDHVDTLSLNSCENKSNFRWLDPELPFNNIFKARATHIDYYGQVWLQLEENKHTVRLLKRLLNEKYNLLPSEEDVDNSLDDSNDLTVISSLNDNPECCVRWRDGNWYRARAINVPEEDDLDNKVLVFLVDWGNTYRADPKNIRTNIYGFNIPIQAFSSVLCNVGPVGNSWSQECVDHISDIVQYDKRRMKLNVFLHQELVTLPHSLPVPVSITLPRTFKLDLANLLVDIGKARPVNLYKDIPVIDDYHGVHVVPPGHYKEKNPDLLLLPNCQYLLQIPVYDEKMRVSNWVMGEEIDQEVNYINGQYATFPGIDWTKCGIGSIIPVTVEEVDSPTTVTVVLLPYENEYLNNISNELYLEMSILKKEVTHLPPIINPSPGLPVAVLWDMKEWCRGEVLQPTESQVYVSYVDHGTKDWVGDSMMIRELPSRYCKLPAFSARLELAICIRDVEDDIIVALLYECIWSCGEDNPKDDMTPISFQVMCVSESGGVRGHLIDNLTGKPVYQRLVNENLITLVN